LRLLFKSEDTLLSDQPHPTDVHVGRRIRLRRRAEGLSQEKLADGLGLTFQQVQKYERGANRVSASKLHQIGEALGVSVGWFFEGLEGPEGGPDSGELNRFLMCATAEELISAWPKLSTRTQRDLTRLVTEIAGHASPDAEA
jgi:transcriptional regulator with XRE-family HTH domain